MFKMAISSTMRTYPFCAFKNSSTPYLKKCKDSQNEPPKPPSATLVRSTYLCLIIISLLNLQESPHLRLSSRVQTFNLKIRTLLQHSCEQDSHCQNLWHDAESSQLPRRHTTWVKARAPLVRCMDIVAGQPEAKHGECNAQVCLHEGSRRDAAAHPAQRSITGCHKNNSTLLGRMRVGTSPKRIEELSGRHLMADEE